MEMSDSDPIIKQYREQISDNDLKILEAVNKRLQLVGKLKQYKEDKGIGFVDPVREDWIITYLARSNRGPLSREGLEKLFKSILVLTKEELTRSS
jgi:chorismate mutase